jgi:hypothetical protein
MRWEGHVARMRKMRNANTILFGNPEGNDQLKDRDTDVRIIEN